MLPYNSPERLSSDQGGSVDRGILHIQRGLAASKINTAYTFIPCDLHIPEQVLITPIKLGTTSANGVAFFTTTVGWEIDDVDEADLTAVSGLDAHAASIAYVIGNIVRATEAGGTEKAYICVTAHTSTAGPDFDTDIDNWQELSTTTFIKITHTAAGSAKVANFAFSILGYKRHS